ncbi:MAG: amidohydrolase family protein [Lentisphaeria bacterium]|nr:amidohydrolase family protein [Lentisphaeria bacterium]
MSEWKAIVHGTLIDGTGAAPVTDSVVLVKGKRVVTAGAYGAVEIPPDAQEIDVSGKTVMPGLIDGHAHVGGDTAAIQVLQLSLQRGITTVCSVSANTSGIKLRDGIDAGQVRGCARLVAGCVVCPTHGHVKFRTADGPWEVRKAVREMVMAGADFIKTAASGGFWAADEKCSVRNYTLEELVALADEAHAWDRPVVVHAHTQPGIGNSIEAGVDQIHHGAFIDEVGVRGILEKQLYYMPTLRVTSDRNLDAWPDRPWMIQEMRESQPVHRAGVRLAHEIGVKICVGTDYPGSAHGWKVGDATPFELQELIACGLSPMETIVAATKTNAEAFRKEADLGTLTPGKFADILVVEGDPLQDIGILYHQETINVVFKEGEVASADEAHKHLYRVRLDQPLRCQGVKD